MMNNTTRATSPSSGQHNARPIITCGICFSILTEPVTFGCSHSFCTRCVRTRLDKSGVGDGFTCPLCNQVHQSVSVRNLQEFADVQLADRIARMSRGEDARPMCQWCEESPASLFCNECQYTLCSDCNVAVHKNAAKRGHAPALLGDGRTTIRNATRKCDVRGHEEYRLEFYCVKCEELCCAYCLQIAPHRGHESMLVSKAAQEVRQRMGRDLENLGQVKANIESMANELNRVHGQYLETYDHVESLITDRFNAFRHQLVQREVEVRKILQNLRDNGDAVLCQSRLAYMLKLNNINEAGITFRRLQHGGADFEVLQNRSAMSAFVQMSIPTVVGTGFRLSDLGDLNLAGLAVSMDLHSTEASGGGGGASQIPLPAANSTFSVPPAVSGQLSRTGSQQDLRAQRRTQGPAVFTFGNDPDVEITPTAEGTLLKCNDTTPKEAGVHTRETFESLKPRWSEFNGKISWKVRLDLLRNGFIGVVETDTRGGLPNGFHWQPMIQGSFDCTVGRVTPVCKSLPVCKPRDVITFTYDTGAAALSIGVNGIDRGVAVTNVHSRTAPCFILSAGEVVTMIPA